MNIKVTVLVGVFLAMLVGSLALSCRAAEEAQVSYQVQDAMGQPAESGTRLLETVERNGRSVQRLIFEFPRGIGNVDEIYDRWSVGSPAPPPSATWAWLAFPVNFARPTAQGYVVFLNRRTGAVQLGRVAPGQPLPKRWGKDGFYISAGLRWVAPSRPQPVAVLARVKNNSSPDDHGDYSLTFVPAPVGTWPLLGSLGRQHPPLKATVEAVRRLHGMYATLNRLTTATGSGREQLIGRLVAHDQSAADQQKARAALRQYQSARVGPAFISRDSRETIYVTIEVLVRLNGRDQRVMLDFGRDGRFYADQEHC